MEKILTNRNLNKSIALKIIPIMLISMILSITWILNIKSKLDEESRNHVLEVNKQVANSIEDKLNHRLESLNNFAKQIENIQDDGERNEFMKYIHELNDSTLFKYLHIIDTEGYTVCEDEDVYLGDREYFKNALMGKNSISGPVKGRINYVDEYVINFGTPIEIDGKIIGVLVGTHSLDYIKESLVTSIYSNENSDNGSNMYLFDNNYEIIISTYGDIEQIENTEIDIAHNDINKAIVEDDEIYIIHTSIFDDESWHLVTTIQCKLINQNSSQIILILIVVAIIINIILFLILFMMIKNQYNNKEYLKKMAFEDKLTGIDNYDKFAIDVKEILKNTKDKFIIICFDIKNFKFINKILGYEVGDEILKQISINIPKYINGKYKYARMSNDIFVIAIKIDNETIDIENIVSKIRDNIIVDKISEDILKFKEIELETSIGIYIVNNYYEDIKVMVDYANLARQKSKEINTISHYIFEEDILKDKEERISIEKSIPRGLKRNEFKVYYQPKVCINTKKVVGAEALIRWHNKERGVIKPDKFIPIAENSGSIHLITKWVIQQVCKDLRMWQDKGYNVVPISINVSGVELYQSDFINCIEETLETYNIDTYLLEIEITETMALNDIEYINNKIKEVKDLGIKVSMDDFGTGYSTLSNLKLLDIDILKIDRSLLVDIQTDDKSKYIVKAIIDFANILGYEVVCEGVEHKEQVEILKDMDCDIIQGFVFYKPMNIQEIDNIIKEL